MQSLVDYATGVPYGTTTGTAADAYHVVEQRKCGSEWITSDGLESFRGVYLVDSTYLVLVYTVRSIHTRVLSMGRCSVRLSIENRL